jgi:hypothetical protein
VAVARHRPALRTDLGRGDVQRSHPSPAAGPLSGRAVCRAPNVAELELAAQSASHFLGDLPVVFIGDMSLAVPINDAGIVAYPKFDRLLD